MCEEFVFTVYLWASGLHTTILFDSTVITLKKVKELESSKFKGFIPGLFGRGGAGKGHTLYPLP